LISYTGFTWVQLLGLFVSVILPAIVALVTNRFATSQVKSLTLLALAALTGFLTELFNALDHGTGYDVRAGIFSWAASFVVAVVSHYGLLKPTAVTGTNGLLATALPSGVGRHRAKV
jgi:hypothetical protein